MSIDLAEIRMARAQALAVKANQALLDKEPLVFESEEEKMAIRSYAEREYSYWKNLNGDPP